MLTKQLSLFERNFRRAIQADKSQEGFTDSYLLRHYLALPVIFEGNPGHADSLESLTDTPVTDDDFTTFAVSTLTSDIELKVFPFPFKDVVERLQTSEPLAEEMMAMAHFIYLSFYFHLWAVRKNISDVIPSNFKLSKNYYSTLKEWFDSGKPSPVKMEAEQIKFLRLNYVYLVSFLMENSEF